MKDKVKSYLNNDDEKELWEELYKAFEEGGEEKLKEVIAKKQPIESEFNDIMEKIKNKLEA